MFLQFPQGINANATFGLMNVSDANADEKSYYSGLNISNILSYVPGVNAVVGIARVVFTTIAAIRADALTTDQKWFYATQVLRGLSEVADANFLLLPVDILFTIDRVLGNGWFPARSGS